MILLTGGSGFIGSHFNNYLQSDQFINLDLNKPFFPTKAQFVQGDIRVAQDVDKVLRSHKITSIISLAAKHHDFGIGHDEYFDTNEGGTQVLCDLASRHGIKKIIFYSSVAVYGLREAMTTEAFEPTPDAPYGASKLAGEAVLRRWAAADPSRKVLVIRPTLVFGANNRANMYNLIRQIDKGAYFNVGSSKNIKSIAYVENLVQATLFLQHSMQPGVTIYNYADEPQLSVREITENIARRLSKKIRFSVPLGLAVFLALPFDLAIRVTGKNLPVSSARVKKLATQTYHSAAKLFDLGFRPTYTTVQGLEKMVDWYKATKQTV
jgi:GlcNAc-P-P-Und epimerase